ncbi:putative transcriptional regulator vib-1 [Phaeomoniella chlamydospora]|uniref:Putative transcriptional regulator vib-1 n=1 Tax=Phaeomoniella chlamydospora TaxID=158046 RepID=A0A0G2G2N3_PHACM|nr:putative transcriptional regulator vib-1 [Phaeomoniella chlamydospora]
MHGMFFLAESPFTSNSPDQPPPPPELTCYRRNLFQITGTITLPRTLRYIMTDQGDRIPILAQELTISATESVEGNPVKIISVPWKTPAGGGTATAEEKVEKEPPSIPLDTMAGQDLDADYAAFPVTWKRLQFRIATANNGRRKELQQHFVIRLKVVAILSTGAKVSIAESQSGAIIVRGRSPRNFQSRKDFPLSNSASSRKAMHPPMSRTSTGDSAAQPPAKQAKTSPDPNEGPPMIFHFDGKQIPQSSPELSEWNVVAQDTKPAMASTPLTTPTYPVSHVQQSRSQSVPGPWPTGTDLSSPGMPIANPSVAAAMNVSAPINLSFSDDESSPGSITAFPRAPSNPPTSNPSPQFSKPRTKTSASPTSAPTSAPTSTPQLSEPPKQRPRLLSHAPSSTVVPSLNSTSPMKIPLTSPILARSMQQPLGFSTSPEEIMKNGSADHLYEYVPLGLEDWMPPVDAVYRPHIVHHTGPQPLDPKGLAAGRFRSKRYFSEDG